MNEGLDKLMKVSKRIRLMNELQIISRNSSHYRLPNELAEYFGTKRIVKHKEVDISIFENIIYVDSANDELFIMEDLLT